MSTVYCRFLLVNRCKVTLMAMRMMHSHVIDMSVTFKMCDDQRRKVKLQKLYEL